MKTLTREQVIEIAEETINLGHAPKELARDIRDLARRIKYISKGWSAESEPFVGCLIGTLRHERGVPAQPRYDDDPVEFEIGCRAFMQAFNKVVASDCVLTDVFQVVDPDPIDLVGQLYERRAKLKDELEDVEAEILHLIKSEIED